ncbi:MAG: hypothetical protein MUP61_00275 [Burkholderiales bacterium]|nr:hypothetical protein [Burkholderiales bacterium]
MGILNNLFGQSTSSSFTGHVLEPGRGYYTTVITPNTKDHATRLSRVAVGNNIYILVHFENGERIENLVRKEGKETWLKLKQIFVNGSIISQLGRRTNMKAGMSNEGALLVTH